MKSIFFVFSFVLLSLQARANSKCSSNDAYNAMKVDMAQVAKDLNFKSYTIPKTDWLGGGYTIPQPSYFSFPVQVVTWDGKKRIGLVTIDPKTCQAAAGISSDDVIEF